MPTAPKQIPSEPDSNNFDAFYQWMSAYPGGGFEGFLAMLMGDGGNNSLVLDPYEMSNTGLGGGYSDFDPWKTGETLGSIIRKAFGMDKNKKIPGVVPGETPLEPRRTGPYPDEQRPWRPPVQQPSGLGELPPPFQQPPIQTRPQVSPSPPPMGRPQRTITPGQPGTIIDPRLQGPTSFNFQQDVPWYFGRG